MLQYLDALGAVRAGRANITIVNRPLFEQIAGASKDLQRPSRRGSPVGNRNRADLFSEGEYGTAMPRFFITLTSDGQQNEDDVGSDLPDAEAALAEARDVVRELVMERLKMGEGPLSEEVELRDGEGRLLHRRRITVMIEDAAS